MDKLDKLIEIMSAKDETVFELSASKIKRDMVKIYEPAFLYMYRAKESLYHGLNRTVLDWTVDGIPA